MKYFTTSWLWHYWKALMLFFAGIYVGDAIHSGIWIPGIVSLFWLALYYRASKIEATDIQEMRRTCEELTRLMADLTERTEQVKALHRRISQLPWPETPWPEAHD